MPLISRVFHFQQPFSRLNIALLHVRPSHEPPIAGMYAAGIFLQVTGHWSQVMFYQYRKYPKHA